MEGVTPTGASTPRMTLDRLAERLITRMVVHEVICVALVALSMFLIWSGPGRPWGTIIVLIVGVIVIARVWGLPDRDLQRFTMDTATDPDGAAEQMQRLADKTLKTLLIPTFVGFLATVLSGGWQPVFFGALISIGGYTFFGPSRTRLSVWRDRMEDGGGKTGL
jgi:hypothetical protein